MIRQIALLALLLLMGASGSAAQWRSQTFQNKESPPRLILFRPAFGFQARAPQLAALDTADVSDDFTLIGLLVGAGAGAIVGGFVGQVLDKQFGWSGGDDPGLGGRLVGILVGGTAGAIWGGHKSSWPGRQSKKPSRCESP